MTHLSDLIIRTPEERGTEEERNRRGYVLVETSGTSGVQFDAFLGPADHLPAAAFSDGARAWKFRDAENLHLFASHRILELHREGAKVLGTP